MIFLGKRWIPRALILFSVLSRGIFLSVFISRSCVSFNPPRSREMSMNRILNPFSNL